MAAEVQLADRNQNPNLTPNLTIDLQQQVARLQALLEASRHVHSTIHEEDVLKSVLRLVVRELEMDGAAFSGTELSYGRMAADPAALLRFPLYDRDGGHMTDLEVTPPEGRALTLYESDFLEGLALQASVALENARNHKRNVEFARVQQDLDAARNIQRSLLPQRLPAVPGYSIGFKSKTCYEVGGDYLDIVEMPDGTVLLVVADVAGKGLASAIVSVSFRSAFRAAATLGLPLNEIATRMNQSHWEEGDETRRRYVTAIFARFDPKTGELEAVNAGHNPGFVLHPDGKLHQFDAAGTPLGLLPGMSYSTERCDFPPGSRLLFYTDGLTEAFCGEEEFGTEQLIENFSRYQSSSADAILDKLWRAIEDFCDGGPQSDDMTALVLSRIAEGSATGSGPVGENAA
jgi:serine phosphatase RsbU (regulator of sigma subunit)